jgi:hypothetical protein
VEQGAFSLITMARISFFFQSCDHWLFHLRSYMLKKRSIRDSGKVCFHPSQKSENFQDNQPLRRVSSSLNVTRRHARPDPRISGDPKNTTHNHQLLYQQKKSFQNGNRHCRAQIPYLWWTMFCFLFVSSLGQIQSCAQSMFSDLRFIRQQQLADSECSVRMNCWSKMLPNWQMRLAFIDNPDVRSCETALARIFMQRSNDSLGQQLNN